MKQLFQSLRSGVLDLADIPSPRPGSGQVLIRTTRSLISTGTERMLLDFGKANWLEKARQQPDKVRMVLDKIKTDGLATTLEAVRNKLDQPLALGYCHVGRVMAVGSGVSGFSPGDRVASNGRHAEAVAVPAILSVRIPDQVSDDAAAFTVIGAIALQGVRLVAPTLGEAVVVTGLGLIGLLTAQLLRAQGCRVLGLDFDPAKLALARQFGAETVDLASGQDVVAAANVFSRGRGVDAVIVTAATKSSEPIHQAALMCRKRGRIVLVGVTGLELSRADFYEKELTFQVSCSYGPGRYDPNYEERGQDYPLGFVRWTEQRNFEAVLDMMADGRLDVAPLISHRFPFAAADQAYAVLTTGEPLLGVVLTYPEPAEMPESELRRAVTRLTSAAVGGSGPVLGVIGAGNYASAVLIPAFRQPGVRLKWVVSQGGASGYHAGRKYGFEQTTTEVEAVLGDAEVNAVVICTRHDSHPKLVCQALAAGKHVFVEKPLAIDAAGLEAIEAALAAVQQQSGQAPLLMVGFNRRFAPHIQAFRALLKGGRAPLSFILTANVGAIPAEHWTQAATVGGGRVIGEACHFVDLLRYLADAPLERFQAEKMVDALGDTVTVTLRFTNGSIGTIHYFANGSKSFPKERLEIFGSGRVLQLDNFRVATGYGWPGFRRLGGWRQDKGQKACAAAFLAAVAEGGEAPIPLDQVLEVARATIRIGEALG